MRFYAERPVRLIRQLVLDLLIVAWVVLCVQVAGLAHDAITQLQGPALSLTGAGESIRGTFDEAARTASGVPLVGEALAQALSPGRDAGSSLADAGRQTSETIATAADWTAIGIVVLAVVPVVLGWLVSRIRYAVRARSAVRARDVDSDLLALRAMTHLPVRTLLAVSPDPAAAWRRDDREVVRRLAALELRSLGLRAPRAAPD